MGYFLVGICGLVLVVAIFSLLARSGQSRGRVPADKPVEVQKPAADGPTPARSVTASVAQAERASHRTPPA